jgi:hypothetical protein
MAVVSVGEQYSRSGSMNSRWQRTYTRQWKVITNDPNDGPKTVREALPVSLGNSYSTPNEVDKGSYVNSIDAVSEGDDGLSWLVNVQYGPYDATINPQDPTQRPIELNYEASQFQRPSIEDVNGKAIANSAGDPFDPPLMKDDSRPVFVITRNEMTYNDEVMATYRDTVNSDVFFGYGPMLVKCHSITGRLAYDPDIHWYYVVTYRFEHNKDGWHKKPLDAGFRTNPAGATSPAPIFDKAGLPISVPALLDGHGLQLTDGADPVFLDIQDYVEKPFEPLNITREQIPHN